MKNEGFYLRRREFECLRNNIYERAMASQLVKISICEGEYLKKMNVDTTNEKIGKMINTSKYYVYIQNVKKRLSYYKLVQACITN